LHICFVIIIPSKGSSGGEGRFYDIDKQYFFLK
jgi:hypothetical protein